MFYRPACAVLLLFLPAAFFFSGCGSSSNTVAAAAPVSTPAPTPPTPPAPPAIDPFSRVVVLGDSISAGFQNGSLLDSQQPHGWASLVATQAGFPMTLPLMGAPGFPAVYELLSAGLPPVVQQLSGVTTGRDNPNAQINDFAVPGHKLYDLLNTGPVAVPTTGDQLMTNYVLGFPLGATGTQVVQAVAQRPTLVYVWIGGDDALPADATGDPSAMTPVNTFSSEFAQLLASLPPSTQAHLVVANVPDVTQIPYMTQASELLQLLGTTTHLPTSLLSAAFHLYPGDLVNAHGLEDLEADLKRLESFQLPVPLSDSDVLTAAEIPVVQGTINEYNQAIAQQVAAAGGTVVDAHGYIGSLAANGITINGYAASTLFLGGLFGLDGIHPTNTGYALLANQFIAATNTALGTAIVPVNVSAVAEQDPYFGPNRVNSSLPYTRETILPAITRQMDAVFGTGRRP